MKLKPLLSTFALVASAAFAASAYAEAPAGSTGQCKDDTYTTATSKRGACAAHGGVKDWYGTKKSKSTDSKAKTTTSAADASKTSTSSADSKSKKSTSSKAADSTTAAAAPAAATTAAAAAPAATAKPAAKSADMRTEAAAGGGAGKVWVNTKSKVYHCQGDEWYGKTKEGEYMSESAAKTAGAHADHGKACG